MQQNRLTTDDLGEDAVDRIRTELGQASPSAGRRALEKFVLAALGSIPWLGGFISAAAAFKFEEPSLRAEQLQNQWLGEHHNKFGRLMSDLTAIADRLESLGDSIHERVQSEEYLALVRRAFRAWDRADTEEKRRYVGNLVGNAAGTRVCSDDVARLFIDWIDSYHESHFAVIREIYQKPHSTRLEVWSAIYGDLPREDSAEADLFRLLVRDLSAGGVIRQERETTPSGQFLRRKPSRSKVSRATLKSSFDDEEEYVLTELGKQFVHYTMNEVVPRLDQVNPWDSSHA